MGPARSKFNIDSEGKESNRLRDQQQGQYVSLEARQGVKCGL
jgi:hypothetical protein